METPTVDCSLDGTALAECSDKPPRSTRHLAGHDGCRRRRRHHIAGTRHLQRRPKLPSGTSLTLKNPETDNTQVLLTGKISLHDQTNGASLYLENLSIDPSGDYFFDGTPGDINTIAVEGVRIFGVRRCFIRANQSTALIGTLRFNNSLIYNNVEGGYNFICDKTKVGKVKVSNSTLYNYSGGESFFSRHSAPKDSDHLFRFEMSNNTVYRWSKGSGYALCKTDDSFSIESEFIFRNNLVYQPGVEG